MEANGTSAGRISPLARLRAIAAALLWRPLAWLCVRLFGRVDWQAPAWGAWVARSGRRGGATLRANPRATFAALAVAALLAGGAWYGYQWWKAQPKPLEVTFQVTAPTRTEIESEDAEARKPKPAVIVFDHSVAPISQVGKDVAAGVTLSPALAGAWHWDDDKKLSFTPKDDWAAGAEYTVRFKKGLFKPEARLADRRGQIQHRAHLPPPSRRPSFTRIRSIRP